MKILYKGGYTGFHLSFEEGQVRPNAMKSLMIHGNIWGMLPQEKRTKWNRTWKMKPGLYTDLNRIIANIMVCIIMAQTMANRPPNETRAMYLNPFMTL